MNITDKQGLEKKIEDFDRKILDVSNLISNTTLKTNIDEVNKKIPDVSGLVTNTALNAKIDKLRIEFLIMLNIFLLLNLLNLLTKYLIRN